MTFASTGTGNGQWQYGRLTTDQFTITAPPGKRDFPVTDTTLPGFRLNFTPTAPGLDLSTEAPVGGDFDGDGRSDATTWSTANARSTGRYAYALPPVLSQ